MEYIKRIWTTTGVVIETSIAAVMAIVCVAGISIAAVAQEIKKNAKAEFKGE